MNPENLTRDEALARSRSITVDSYKVAVDLTGAGADGSPLPEPTTNFLSTSTVQFNSTDGADTWIDLIADSVVAVALDGRALPADAFAGARIALHPTIGDHTLTVTAICRYSHTGEGLHRFVDPADQRVYLYSQFETADARRMYACFEQPDLKAKFQLTVRAPEGWAVVSNSPTPTPSKTDEHGAQVWEFEPTPPISTYITALIAGEYHVDHGTLKSGGHEIGADLVCRRSMVAYLDAERIRTTTQRGFDVYEVELGSAYPFAKYDQLFVPEYNAGAMENAGAVTLRDEYLFRSKVTAAMYEGRDNTILHELAHMWFGDLVTMRWWDDLWLNESFAEWASHHCQQRIVESYGGVDPWVSFASARKGWAYAEDQLPSTHPIAADMVDLSAVEQNFDGITYAKGASVLKVLVATVGEEEFLAGVRAYLGAHAFANAEFADLLAALQKASGRDLSGFSDEWLSTSGVNTLRIDAELDGEGRFTRFEVLQSAPKEYPTLRTHHLAIGLYDFSGGALKRTALIELDVSGPQTTVAALLGKPQPALVLLNDGDLAYAKVRLDEHSFQTARDHIGAIADPLARALLWSSAWDMTRDAELSAAEFVELVKHGVGAESDMTAVRSLLARAHTAVTAYTAPAGRTVASASLMSGLKNVLAQADPGSDHQLSFADAIIANADSADDGSLIAGWLAGEEVPDGLTIDQDRRWAIISALASLGKAGEEEIAAEAARDNTISGAESAAGARAAMLDPAAKAAAWQLATADPSVPNGTHSEICGSFMQYGQEELIAPYAERYLEVCALISAKSGIWAKRGHAISESVLNGLWPMPVADRAFLERVDQWLAETERSESVRHDILDQRDLTLRALAAQEFGARNS